MANVQPVTSYSDTTAQKETIADLIDIIDPDDTPVLSYFGLDGDPGAFQIQNWPNRKVKWLEDTLADISVQVTTSGGSYAKGDTKFTLVSGDSDKVKPGDILEITGSKYDRELVWVSGVATDVKFTVVRGKGGTSTTVGDGATLNIVGNARLEGEDADYERGVTDVSEVYNVTQIFQEDLKITRTADRVQQWGKSTEWDYQTAKQLPHLMRLIEQATFRQDNRQDGSASAPRMFGGFDYFVSTNTTSLSGAPVTPKDITDIIQSIWEDGGDPSLLICNAHVKRKISSFYGGFVRTERSEDHGGVTINYLDTEFGTVQLLMSRWCPKTKLYVLTPEYVGYLAFDPFFREKLAKTGDATKGQVLGEYTLVVKNEKAHGYIENISTTS